ncbi:MAG TPA: YggS family pyridoxal phosphate-dependent enzyme, partial [Actinomycetota bacterium]|nr:YggS family pyridoxal phosphate-dependent enzyme [Actinomycetota bacterium]
PVSAEVLAENVARVRERIARAAERAGRDPSEVTLVGVTKEVPPEVAARAVAAGVTDLGENYVRELAAKRAAVPGARWHFIGILQSHTAHKVAELADVVETVASERAATRLARRAAARGRRLPVLIEVDLTGDRAGVAPEDLGAFADRVAGLEGVELVGLMTVPPIPGTPEDSRPYFRRLRELRDRLRARHPGAVELSMGMSLDYEVAVEEGATMVRVGTALFGPRRRGRA